MKTIDTILEDMETRVKENHPVSPANWVDAGIKINALRGDLDNDIAEYEAQLVFVEANFIKEGKPQTTAKALARGDDVIIYEEYLRAKAKAKRIEEFIRLAKKRATLNDYNS